MYNNEQCMWSKKNKKYVEDKLTDLGYEIFKTNKQYLTIVYKKKLFDIYIIRNKGRKVNSRQFIFPYTNSDGAAYKIDDNSYVAFIDDLTGDISIVRYKILKSALSYCSIISSAANFKRKFYILPKKSIHPNVVLKASEEDLTVLKSNLICSSVV